ncbi:hypothetical protein [Saccharopolyspora gregorii]|uniref:hypothetical protein n=1 Tax=Saccharopolyspora gregorii TaxID=33914 RepID=UPI0031EF98C6
MPGRAPGGWRAVLALDAWHQQRLLAESIEHHGVLATWSEVLSPVLTAVTERWQHTGTGWKRCAARRQRVDRRVTRGAGHRSRTAQPAPVLLAPVPGSSRSWSWSRWPPNWRPRRGDPVWSARACRRRA